jgi:hypothetical protein
MLADSETIRTYYTGSKSLYYLILTPAVRTIQVASHYVG